jgi:hypothetical protein
MNPLRAFRLILKLGTLGTHFLNPCAKKSKFVSAINVCKDIETPVLSVPKIMFSRLFLAVIQTATRIFR